MNSTFGLCALLNTRSVCRQGLPPALAPRKRCRNSRHVEMAFIAAAYMGTYSPASRLQCTQYREHNKPLQCHIHSLAIQQTRLPPTDGDTSRPMAPDHINCLAKPRNQGGTHARVHVGRGGGNPGAGTLSSKHTVGSVSHRYRSHHTQPFNSIWWWIAGNNSRAVLHLTALP